MVTSSYLNRSTPGVYITEIEGFGSSIVGVATGVPVFIGYTEFAGDPATGAALYHTPVPLNSMNDYLAHFGGPALLPYQIAVAPAPDFTAAYAPGGGAAGYVTEGFALSPRPGHPRFSLYWQMLMFFANGGGSCYVVSVGSYWSNQLPASAPADSSGWLPGTISAADLLAGIAAAGQTKGPTMTVVPEACQLPPDAGVWSDYGVVIRAMMTQAGTLQDRVAILDLPGCLDAASDDALVACQSNLWAQTGPAMAYASYAAAYAPALIASIVTPQTIRYTNLVAAEPAGNGLVNGILTAQANQLYSRAPAQLASVQAAIAAAFPLTSARNTANTAFASDDSTAYPGQQPGQSLAQWQTALDNLLQSSLPVFKQIEQLIADQMNVLAPSGAMAGVWAASDQRSGVWSAPANIAVAAVTGPLFNMSDDQQGDFNVPVNGQSIAVLRVQANRGTVVWGARTLDGNSDDYRYIEVRRTLIYIEQSIKLALQNYVFAANDAQTWSAVASTVSGFLTGLWQAGGLLGASPAAAFTVSCGLGSTMTSQNVLDGTMVVAVTVSLVHPAEFIELTFTQTMGS